MEVTSFTTVSLMMLRFPALTSRSSVTSAELFYHAQTAVSEITTKLAKYYSLPVVQTGGSLHVVLSDIATRLALQSYLEERAFTQERSNMSEWPKAFDKARELLDAIANNAIPLVNNDGTIVAMSTSEVEVWSDTSGYLPTFTEDDPINQEVDPNKIDDIRNDRIW